MKALQKSKAEGRSHCFLLSSKQRHPLVAYSERHSEGPGGESLKGTCKTAGPFFYIIALEKHGVILKDFSRPIKK